MSNPALQSRAGFADLVLRALVKAKAGPPLLAGGKKGGFRGNRFISSFAIGDIEEIDIVPTTMRQLSHG